MRQNRMGRTETIPYNGYEILVRRKVRNDSDISYSVIVVKINPIDNSSLIKKRFANIKTKEKELLSIEKAKTFIDSL